MGVSVNAWTVTFYAYVILSFNVHEIRLSQFENEIQSSNKYSDISRVILTTTNANVYNKGTYQYNEKRIVHNGLCKNVFPDLVVEPTSTEDVSRIIKIA